MMLKSSDVAQDYSGRDANLKHMIPYFLMVFLTQSAVVPPPATPPTKPSPVPAPVSPAVKETPDYPEAIWLPAATGNFKPANRPTEFPINMIVIHDIEGTAESAVAWFQNPKAQVSSHYVVDAVHGRVWQQVKEHDVAWHAGNREVNNRAIGIEHEGFSYRPGFYLVTEYETSARLVRSISQRNNIPRDRTHIIGHFEVPNLAHPGQFGGSNGHTDPGPYWDWDYFMTLVRNDARVEQANFPTVLHPGEKGSATLDMTNLGDDPWPSVSGQNDPARETQGPVYLGGWASDPEDGGRLVTSALYSAGTTGWISPRLAASPFATGADVAKDTAPAAIAHFSFPVQAPAFVPPAPIVEQFRLIKVLPAPHTPVGFGPLIPVTVQVVPWEIVSAANSGSGFSAGKGWTKKGNGDATVWVAKSPTSQATTAASWSTKLPIGGTWRVEARWSAGKERTKKATYTIATTDGVKTVTVDQSKGGGDWQSLGEFPLSNAAPISVTLTGSGGGEVAADAVRFVGPFAPLPPAAIMSGPRP